MNGLYANIHAKRKRGEQMRKKGDEGAPTEQDFKKAAKTANSQTVPKSVRDAANKGLALRLKFGRGGLSTQEAGKLGIGSGVARARDLANGKVSLSTIKRMKGYFARHASDKDAKGSDSAGYFGDKNNPSSGYIAWMLWGGDAGEKWVNGILKDESN